MHNIYHILTCKKNFFGGFKIWEKLKVLLGIVTYVEDPCSLITETVLFLSNVPLHHFRLASIRSFQMADFMNFKTVLLALLVSCILPSLTHITTMFTHQCFHSTVVRGKLLSYYRQHLRYFLPPSEAYMETNHSTSSIVGERHAASMPWRLRNSHIFLKYGNYLIIL